MFKKDFNQGCVLVIGGAKSGKSRLSMDICSGLDRKKIFLATAQALDNEMKERIERHKEERGGDWVTVEEPMGIVDKISELDSEDTVILLDCLTLWISNLFMEYGEAQEFIDGSVDELLDQLTSTRGIIIIVSNEVGMGIVPDNELVRFYRDSAGSLNQRIAGIARKVVAVMAGIPLVLKDE
jgi:adenosylcobinamide kinase/adenosylcobinamide-phosphate guanylyltransferase